MKYKREGLDLQARDLLGPRPLKYRFFLDAKRPKLRKRLKVKEMWYKH